MSLLKTKQIAGPAQSQHGSVILFDGTKSGWSSDLNGALLLPSGPSNARPEVAGPGHIRHNSETGKLETFNGTDWTDVGITKFSDLVDGPGALQAGKGVRVNAAGTQFEYYTLAQGLVRYRFRIDFTGQTADAVSEVPSGWTVTLPGSNQVNIVHNLNQTPAFASAFGSSPTIPGSYNHRISGATAAGSIGLVYDPTNLNACLLTGCSSSGTGSASDSHAFIEVYFLAS